MYIKRGKMTMMRPEVPANDLPSIPPATDLEPRAVLKQAIAAHTELARLKGYCSLLPNEAVLLNTVVLKEARASSEIENIITTHDELYRALVASDTQIDAETKEVLNYRSAVWTGFRSLRQSGLITTNTLVAIQQELEQNNAGIRTLPGTALVNDRSGETVYTPPDDEQTIRDLLRNLEEYLNQADAIDPLIKMAVAHYQFESIHPFYDGNGRTGRILNVLYLVKEGLLDSPILYLSRYIIKRKSTYYELLQRVRTEADWVSWVLFMLKAVEETARQTLQMTQSIFELMEQTILHARDHLPRSTHSKELIELLFVQPYIKIEVLVRNGIAERRTASKYLKQLQEIGVLDSYQAWKETIYINTRLMELIKGSE